MSEIRIIYLEKVKVPGPVWIVKSEAEYLSALAFAQLASVAAHVTFVDLAAGTVRDEIVSPEDVPEEGR